MQIVKVDPRLFDYGILLDDTMEWFAKKYNKKPSVTIRYTDRSGSSGHAYSWSISIRAGHSIKDFHHVLLHELAHTLTLRYKDIHGDRFYKTFAEMAKLRGISMQDLIARERYYKPRAVGRLARRHRITL